MRVSLCALLAWWLAAAAGAPCQCRPASLCQPVRVPPRSEIVAFYVPDGAADSRWQQFNWTQVTTVVVFGAVPPPLVCHAHQRSVRVVTGEDFDHAQLGNATARAAWVEARLQAAKSAGLDGLNFDIEGSNQHRDGLTALVRRTARRFREELPGSQVTFDLSIYPTANHPGYDFAAIARLAAFVIPMGYDMNWGTTVARPNSPLPSLRHGLNMWAALGVPANRIALGVPWYGYDFPCSTPPATLSRPCDVVAPFGGGRWQVCYDAALALHKTPLASAVFYAPRREAAYFTYESAADQRVHQVWYDDPTTLARKYALARRRGLRGVAFWHATCVSPADGMWRGLHTFLG